ncbi:aldo/keto reductase [Marivibrio halodurans]|uniref:Protein tas n=1 Tax=Marivibrio halodurans TaxID=2039722 RepID=A0A8J7S3D1_9PROT|nr:aldo/keto reductase [Marivibrio halodurans]MBP5857954.1 aldo/keto reductase [Marivibrio halodurans]
MEYRKLGRTDIEVSMICLGTMTWGEQNTEADGHAQIDRAIERGVNFIDTAEMYAVPTRKETAGRTEEILGSWLAENKAKRGDLVIATKVAGRAGKLSYLRPHLHGGETRLDRQSITEAVEGSLRRLGTDYIDLYQLHWPDRKTNTFGALNYRHQADDDPIPVEETLRALDDLVKAGKVRTVGLSNETPWGMMEFARVAEREGLARVVSCQNPYNLLMRNYEFGCAEVSMREDMGLLAYSPLAMGVLSGKYLDGQWPEGARLTLFGDEFKRYLSDRARRETAKYVDIAKRHGLDPSAMACAFVNRRPFVTSNIIGARTMDQLEVLLDSADLDLSQEVLGEIEAIHAETPIGY